MPHKIQMVGTTAKKGRRGTERKEMKRFSKRQGLVQSRELKRQTKKRQSNRGASRR